MGKRSFSSFLRNFSMRKRPKRSSTSTKIREEKEQPPCFITSLPNDVIIDILARVPRRDYGKLSLASKYFQSLVLLPELYVTRSLLGYTKEKEFHCCFLTKEAKGNNYQTVFVKGFDYSLPKDYIKIALGKHFGSCGQVKRVFVHTECKTGVSSGLALINLKNDGEKALTLNGSDLGGRKLEVMAKDKVEYFPYPYTNIQQCKTCRARHAMMRFKVRYYENFGGYGRPRVYPYRWREERTCIFGWNSTRQKPRERG